MYFNKFFLIIGILLSVVSKIIQFVFHMKLGDIIVIPAAIFFVLAILFSVPKFNKLIEQDSTKHIAHVIMFWSCVAIVCFQLLMILVIGNNNLLGLIFVVPCIISVIIVIRKWLII